jgi:hypothetical protein
VFILFGLNIRESFLSWGIVCVGAIFGTTSAFFNIRRFFWIIDGFIRLKG